MATDRAKETERIWTATQRKYMEWLALSSFDRRPFTQEQFAKQERVGTVTLWRWQKLPGFMDEVKKLITDSLVDDYFDVMHSFKQEAKKGSYQHQKMYLEMLGVYTPRSIVEVRQTVIEQARTLARIEGLDEDECVAEALAILAST